LEYFISVYTVYLYTRELYEKVLTTIISEEMKNFARQWIDPVFQFSSLLFLVVAHVSLLVGIILGLVLQSWIIGLSSGISLLVVVYIFLILVWYANKR